MTRIRFFLLGSLVLCVLLLTSSTALQFPMPSAAPVSADAAGAFFDRDFWVKVTIAIVAAILSFIGSYFLAQRKQRSEPRKQLSYDKNVKRGLVEVEKDIREKVTVLYNGRQIRDLHHVSCNIENTGNTVIKNQYVRFEFPEDSEILESFFEPSPEPEMGVQDCSDGLSAHEKRYLIGHIERTQNVGLRFMLTCPSAFSVDLHPYNEEGNVDFVPRTVSMASDEKTVVERFIFLYLMFYLLPPVLFIIPISELAEMGAALIRLAVLISILPTVKPIARVIANLVSRNSRMKAESRVTIGTAERVTISNMGGVVGEKFLDRRPGS